MNSAALKIDTPLTVATHARRTLYYPTLPGAGFIFACTKLTGAMQLPFIGMLAITADRSDINVMLGGEKLQHRALAICSREMRFAAPSTRLVCVAVNPAHPLFRAFTSLKSPHVLGIDRSLFSDIDELFNLAVDGALTHAQTVELFDTALSITSQFLPPNPEIDPRARELVNMLWAHPKCSVTELAEHLGLSYHRTSHLFTEAIGIPVRTYQLWRKIYQACMALVDGASVTEAAHSAGFSDSAHFSSAYQRAYGSSPSDLYMNKNIKVYAPSANSKANGDWLIKR